MILFLQPDNLLKESDFYLQVEVENATLVWTPDGSGDRGLPMVVGRVQRLSPDAFRRITDQAAKVVAKTFLSQRQRVHVDRLLRHLVDAGQAEAGLDEGRVCGKPILDEG